MNANRHAAGGRHREAAARVLQEWESARGRRGRQLVMTHHIRNDGMWGRTTGIDKEVVLGARHPGEGEYVDVADVINTLVRDRVANGECGRRVFGQSIDRDDLEAIASDIGRNVRAGLHDEAIPARCW